MPERPSQNMLEQKRNCHDGQKKRRGVDNSDLEEFMALEKLKQQEEQLRETMIWSGRPGLWKDWQAFQAQARKSRRVQEQLARKRREEFMRALAIFVGIVAGIVGVVGLIVWACSYELCNDGRVFVVGLSGRR